MSPVTDLAGLPAGPARHWLADNVPGIDVSGAWAPEIIAGGLSNITYRLPLASGTLILRRPPVGHLLPRAHDVTAAQFAACYADVTGRELRHLSFYLALGTMKLAVILEGVHARYDRHS